MTKTLSYDGYVAEIEIDIEAGMIYGEVINTRAVLTFEANSVSDLRKAFEDTISDYKLWCLESGEAAERPYSGNLSLRIPPDLHRKVAIASAQANISINKYISDAIDYSITQSPHQPWMSVIDSKTGPLRSELYALGDTISSLMDVAIQTERTHIAYDYRVPITTTSHSALVTGLIRTNEGDQYHIDADYSRNVQIKSPPRGGRQ